LGLISEGILSGSTAGVTLLGVLSNSGCLSYLGSANLCEISMKFKGSKGPVVFLTKLVILPTLCLISLVFDSSSTLLVGNLKNESLLMRVD